jgi:hypothetical protein
VMRDLPDLELTSVDSGAPLRVEGPLSERQLLSPAREHSFESLVPGDPSGKVMAG